ncbi:MAG: DUF2335 domain-containing protein [Candidatus Pacebacteria bacterium]|nr:DUF2335 domain-containing protein [Candidatus Paceibacterota bacterium]
MQSGNKELYKNGEKIIVTESVFSGPLPSPEILEKYNNILPGLADRIVQMAENQQAHRFGLENKVITADIQKQKIGSILGAAIAISIIVAAVVISIYGYYVTGAVIAIGEICGLLGTYIWGVKNKNKELENKKL